MVISLVSFGLFGPALSTTNINIVKWRYFVIFSPVFFCSLNWEFSYSNWEKNILFGIGNTTEYRSSKRAKKNPAKLLIFAISYDRFSLGLRISQIFRYDICINTKLSIFDISYFLSFLSLYTARPSFEYYRQVYFVHSGCRMKAYK